jgi:hypothetical protein
MKYVFEGLSKNALWQNGNWVIIKCMSNLLEWAGYLLGHQKIVKVYETISHFLGLFVSKYRFHRRL